MGDYVGKKVDDGENPVARGGVEFALADPKANVRRGGDNVAYVDTRLPAAKAVGQEARPSLSNAVEYVRTHKGGRSGAAEAADAAAASKARRDQQRAFAREYGMTMAEYNDLMKYRTQNRERQAARTAQFVANANNGKFAGNIVLTGQNWEALAAKPDANGVVAPYKVGDLTKLNAWAKDITGDPEKSNGGMGRYGGKYNMNALPSNIIVYDEDGNASIDASKITSQAQYNALTQMMRQDRSRQGKYVADQKQRQADTDAKNRQYLLEQNQKVEDGETSESLRSRADAIRQEYADEAIKSYKAGDATEDEVVKRMEAARSHDPEAPRNYTATDINKELEKPDSLETSVLNPAMPRTDTPLADNSDVTVGPGGATAEAANGSLINVRTGETRASEAVNLVNELLPAQPKEGTSDKTDQSPKVTSEEGM